MLIEFWAIYHSKCITVCCACDGMRTQQRNQQRATCDDWTTANVADFTLALLTLAVRNSQVDPYDDFVQLFIDIRKRPPIFTYDC